MNPKVKVSGPVKKGNVYTLREAIEELLKTYRLDTGIDQVKAIRAWEQIMGPVISRYTRHISINDRTLYVEITSAALREELSYGKTRIIDLINDAVGSKVIDHVVLR
jgi:predicted nucleic acid-binding Zn ribbon protein